MCVCVCVCLCVYVIHIEVVLVKMEENKCATTVMLIVTLPLPYPLSSVPVLVNMQEKMQESKGATTGAHSSRQHSSSTQGVRLVFELNESNLANLSRTPLNY
jgi:hypothetical protein